MLSDLEIVDIVISRNGFNNDIYSAWQRIKKIVEAVPTAHNTIKVEMAKPKICDNENDCYCPERSTCVGCDHAY